MDTVPWNILLIDDDEDDYILVRDMLSRAQGRQCKLHWAEDYEAGRQALLSGQFDAVLMDYDLGLHTGLELIQTVCANGYQTPIILLSGRGSYEVDLEAMQAGATLYLTKSEVNALLLERSIRYAIERKEMEAALQQSHEELEQRVEARTRQLAEANRALQTANQSLAQAKQELETRVAERTAELRAANEQLAQVNREIERVNEELTWELSERERAENNLEQALADLQQSEQRFSLALKNVPLLTGTIDRDLRYTWIYNPPFSLKVEDLYGKREDEIFPPAGVQDLMQFKRQAVESGQGLHREVRIEIGDGEHILDMSSEPLTGEKGEIEGALIAGYEITELRRLQEETDRRASEAEEGRRMLEAVMEYTPEGITIADARDGKLRMNSKYAQLLAGFSETELTAQPFTQATRAPRVFEPETRAPIPPTQFPLYRAIQQGEVIENEEILLVNRAGETLNMLCNAAPIRDLNGEIVGGIIAWRDITEMKRAEQSVRQSEQLLRRVMDSLFTYVGVLTPGGRLLEVNQAPLEAAGLQREDVYGKLFQETYWWAYDPQVQARIAAALQQAGQGQVVRFDIDARVAGGRLVPLDFMLAPIWDGQGEVQYLIPSAVDISTRKQTEQALETANQDLREREHLLQEVLDVSPVAIYLFDLQKETTIFTNRQLMTILGYSPADIQSFHGQQVDILLHPDDLPRLQDYFEQLNGLPEGQALAVECRLRNAAGEYCWFYTSNLVYERDANGQVLKLLGTAMDVNDLKLAERELGRVTSLLNALSNNTPVMLYAKDRQGRIILANPAVLENVGAPAEAVLGKTDAEFLDKAVSEPIMADDAQVMESGETETFTEILYQPDGEHYYISTKSPFRDAQGEIIGLVGVSVDISAQKAAEAGLNRSQATLRAFFDSSAVLLGVLELESDDYRYELVNQKFASYFRTTPEELRGKTARQIGVPAAAVTKWIQIIQTCLESEEPVSVEETFPIDGIDWWFLVTFSPLPLGAAGQPRVAMTALDIRRRHEMEQELREREAASNQYAAELERSNQALQDFAFTASHDLQEPLRKVKAFSDRLKITYGGMLGNEGQDTIARMQQAVARMEEMIARLLEFSRVTSQVQPFTQVDLQAVAEEVLEDLEVSIAAAGAQVAVEDLPEIQADPLQMRQLLQNLIGNAIKFRRPDAPPQVRVGCLPATEDQIILVVEDNGVGFDMAHAEKLFQPFGRLHPRARFAGSGMGLAICSKIVEHHAGRIVAESEPGAGTKFTVWLPREQHN